MRDVTRRIATPFVLLVVLAVSMPAVLHSYVGIAVRIIRTGSMFPALQPGDAVLVRAVPAANLNVGDIALLFHPNDGEVEAHRLLAANASDFTLSLVTKGDANPMSDDPVLVTRQSAVERVVVSIPKLGYAIAAFDSPRFLGTLCALGLIVLIVIEMQDRRRGSATASEVITP